MTSKTEVDDPSEETLRHQLQIQWQDHIQTRAQTWKTLQVEAALFLAVIAADIKLNNPWILIPLGGVLFVAAIFGMAVTIHHRKVQIQKFKFIFRLEESLGLHKPSLMKSVAEPVDFRWSGIFDFKKIATPTFILVMHILLLIFTTLYIILRLGTFE